LKDSPQVGKEENALAVVKGVGIEGYYKEEHEDLLHWSS